MLTLLLLRHAKAEPHGRGNDFARSLTPKGEVDAGALGAHIAGLSLIPSYALVSSAQRTRQTFALFAEGAGTTIAGRFEASLYNASDRSIRDMLRFVDATVATLMIVGHNPGIMDAASLLATQGDPIELSRLEARFPPCSMAGITFDVDDWRDARTCGGRLDLLLMPEDIPEAG